MKKKLFYLILASILLFNVLIVYADTNSDREKLNSTYEKIEKIKNDLSKNKNDTQAVAKAIEELDLEVDRANSEIQEVENQLKQLNEKISITEQELKQAEENIENKNNTLNSRLRVMYKNGTVGYLEVLLSSSDLSDFLSRLDMVKSIVNQDVELLKYMKEQKTIIEQKKKDLEAQHKSVEAAKRNLENKRNDLILATRAKEDLMRSLEKNKELLEKQYDELNELAKSLEEKILREQTSEDYIGGDLIWPSPGITRITSPFGYRIHPIFKTRKLHTGVDIGVPYGTTIIAANSGRVMYAGWLGGYGKAVLIDHGGGIATLYAHNSQVLVKKGDIVRKGQAISKSGSTGNSTGPHLHFEVRKDGKYIDPLSMVKPK